MMSLVGSPPPLCPNQIVRTPSVQNSMPLRMFSFSIPSLNKEGSGGSQSHPGCWGLDDRADHLSQVTWCCTASSNLVHSFSCPSPTILLVLLSLHSVSDLLLDPTVSALCFLCMDPEIKALVQFAMLLHFPLEPFVCNQDSAISEFLSALHFLPCSLCQLVKHWGPTS